ncbi:cytochrome P450 71D11-like [Humulus lupulus]|uniref:cytochrome P450 71D11-like n=1 Tax=Humulus lupulus TaxID=3486 RepID=UPI002B40CB9A|nr:cytochrome P450 71D11-like [Humulus lupulus]XP_062078757.1 cytochrome P450 71D11-like [Humulus lupulus]
MDLQLPSFPILFSFVFVFMVVIIVLKRDQTKNSVSKLPPGPWRLPLVGNMHQLFGSLPHLKLRDFSKQHGPLMYLKIGQVPILIVSSSEYAKEVMRTHDVVFASRPRTLAAQIIAYNCTDIIFAPNGEYWRQLRKICTQELLSPARVQSFQPVREEELFNLVEGIASKVGSAINLTEMVKKSSYGITSRAAFGKKSRDHDEFISIMEETIKAAGGFEFAEMFPSLSFLDWKSRPKFESIKLRSSRILENIIQEHIKENEISAEKGGRHEDLVDVLLKFHNNGDLGFTITRDNIKGVILDIFVAGGETSALSVDWAMVEMMRNPRVMRKAQDEVREVFGRKGSVDETSIDEMKYLKSVVKETLRLHPPAPLLLPRESREKCDINGYEIPMKTRVMVNVWAIGRDPKYWIEPENFLPERFLDSAIDFKGNNFEYIPFGAGRRICPGMSFGLINVELPLAYLLYHFDWKLPNGMKHENLDMTEFFGVTMRRKDDLYLIPTIYDQSSIAKS